MRTNRPWRGIAVLLAAAYTMGILIAGEPAAAHPLSATAILLDVAPDRVTGSVQLPVDRLAAALGRSLTAASVTQPAELGDLRGYLREHSAAAGTDGTPWQLEISGGRVERVDDVDHLICDLVLTPPGGAVGDFTLTWTAILHRLAVHQVFVGLRPADDGEHAVAGTLTWQRQTLTVPAAGVVAPQTGFLAAMRLGIEHIAEGADHLLFLIMLLLPAPLLARTGRWVRAGDPRRSWLRVVHVVTAFAAGHSITLALASLGYVSLPVRLVESVIALSVLVSGVHAIRPLVRGGEAWIAAGFGLMHGLAFAALVADLGLGRESLVTDLLGFNLGIELTQLIVVALLMPSFLALDRTRLYPGFRIVVAGTGIVLAAAWFAERTTMIGGNPLEPVTDHLVEHPFLTAAAIALVAVVARSVPSWNRDAAGHTDGRVDHDRAELAG
ncbi:HupE/UreJ family protein [Actinoplanes sp. NBRC 101535]|uniref:HupE/UreJ family protein n=1 Tax=Actinoplanes sp. NBRC 101535 TaxID=3032196 RepID=UPI00255243C7|nr:HupE/UreJ family protein [Actinoplanes sp. NBRC 101535]